MKITAFHHHNRLQIGTVFQTMVASFKEGDDIEFKTVSHDTECGKVLSSGGGFATVYVGGTVFECRRWQHGDALTPLHPGHSRWTIDNVQLD